MEQKTKNKRVFCYRCRSEYVVETNKTIKDYKDSSKCNVCGNDNISVENDRGHSIYYKHTFDNNIIY